MLHKLQYAVRFFENSKKQNAEAVITSLNNIEDYLTKGAGTIIKKNKN